MSEMVLGSDERPGWEQNSQRVIDAMTGFVSCLASNLLGLCTYGWTMGDVYIPFAPDPDDPCETEDDVCSQAWVRIAGISVTDVSQNMEGNQCGFGELRLDLEVGVLRCFQIPEGGEAPTATDVLTAAMQAQDDMAAMLCTILGCEVWASVNVGEWSPMGPMADQHGGVWTFTATVE